MKNLKNLGTVLNKSEQKTVVGSFGLSPTCKGSYRDCGNASPCKFGNVCHLGQCKCPDNIF